MKVEVIYQGTETLITLDGVKVKVGSARPFAGTAYAMGSLYKDERGFVPAACYYFQAVAEVDLPSLKAVAHFFFGSLLDTDLYIVEIPRDSALFPEEAQRIFGHYDHERAI